MGPREHEGRIRRAAAEGSHIVNLDIVKGLGAQVCGRELQPRVRHVLRLMLGVLTKQ